GPMRTKEDDNIRDFFGSPESTQRNFRVEVSADLLRVNRDLLRPGTPIKKDVARRNQIHPHSGTPDLASEILDPTVKCRLGRTIRKRRGDAFGSGNGPDHDDASGTARKHFGKKLLDDPNAWPEIEIKGIRPRWKVGNGAYRAPPATDVRDYEVRRSPMAL